MNIDAVWKDRILAMAKYYYENYDKNRLELLLVEEWAKAEKISMPVRSDESPAVRIAKRLRKSLANQPEVVTATFTLVASKVITHLQAAGYDLTDFEIVCAILIAYLVKAFSNEWK